MGVQSLGREGPLEDGMATRSSILAWKVPQREEPDRLQPIGSQSDTTQATSQASPVSKKKKKKKK